MTPDNTQLPDGSPGRPALIPPPRYWHGGPTVRGDMLLPPTVTGSYRSGQDDPFVYVTPTRSLAETYAATCHGWIYEVVPIGNTEDDPGSVLAPGQSLRCLAAHIIRRFRLSRAECERITAVVNGMCADLARENAPEGSEQP